MSDGSLRTNVLRVELDSPYFGYYLKSQSGLRMRRSLTTKYGITSEVCGDYKILTLDGGRHDERVLMKEELQQDWFADDLERALEVLELDETSDFRDHLRVPVRLAAVLNAHDGRRLANLQSRSHARILVDEAGWVGAFGSSDACRRARNLVTDWVRRELGDHYWTPDTESGQTDKGDKYMVAAAQGAAAPVTLSFEVPARAAALIIGKRGQNVADYEKNYRCLIDLRTVDESKDYTSVEITARDLRIATESKDALLRFLDRYYSDRDWPKKVSVSGVDKTDAPTAVGNGVVERMDGDRYRLLFYVDGAAAPRLIGTRGANKRMLEEQTGTLLLLHTERRDRSDRFPVEVITRTAERCLRARQRILAFLDERPQDRRHARAAAAAAAAKADEGGEATAKQEQEVGCEEIEALPTDAAPSPSPSSASLGSLAKSCVGVESELDSSFLESIIHTAMSVDNASW